MERRLLKGCEPPLKPMPIDPVEPASPNPKPPMAPPFVDENPNLASVQDGLNVAENERREAVADAYEATARQSDEAEESLDDIDYDDDQNSRTAPELDAIHEENTFPEES